jgi:hypothetical protein
MAVACTALAVALSGTSYAVVALPAKSVGTKHLKNNAVTSLKVKNNSLTGADIKENRLGEVPVAASARTVPDGAITPSKLGTAPAARVSHSGTQSIPNDSLVALSFDSEAFDTADLHSAAVNSSRLTAPVSGLYELDAAVDWFVNPTGSRVAQIWKNNTTIIVSDNVAPTNDDDHVLSTLVRLSAGDFVELKVKQTSGGSLLVATGSGVSAGGNPYLAMHWVGPA